MHQGIETGCRATEDQANQFASALLMPRASFAAEFPAMRGGYLSWPALKELKLRWKVSFKALIYRVRSLDLLTAEQAKSGFTHLNRKSFTKDEEFDDLIPTESPALVQRATHLLDYATWKRFFWGGRPAPKKVTGQFLFKVPASPLRLVGRESKAGGASYVPPVLLLNHGATTLETPLTLFVGTVIATGGGVHASWNANGPEPQGLGLGSHSLKQSRTLQDSCKKGCFNGGSFLRRKCNHLAWAQGQNSQGVDDVRQRCTRLLPKLTGVKAKRQLPIILRGTIFF